MGGSMDIVLVASQDQGSLAVWALVVAIVGVGIALGSLILAAIAWRGNKANSERIIAIEEGRDEKAARDEAKAIMQPTYHFDGSQYLLEIINCGSGRARDVQVFLDGTPLRERTMVVTGDRHRSDFAPGDKECYRIQPNQHVGPSPKRIHITWTDGSGERGNHESGLG